MGQRKKRYRRLLYSLVLMALLVPTTIYAADQFEIDRIGKINHYEWEDVCIYAHDVTYTLEEIETMLSENTLEQSVIEHARGEVRVAPKYRLMDNGLERADLSKVKPAVSEEGYPVRLYVRNHSSCYITVRLKVVEDIYVIQEKVIWLEAPETETLAAETERKSRQPEAVPEYISETHPDSESDSEKEETHINSGQAKDKVVEKGNGMRKITIYTILIIGFGILGFVGVRKEIHVLHWYSKKLKR